MTLIELLLAAVSLSLDAVAVGTCYGIGVAETAADKAAIKRRMWLTALVVALYFGGAQMLMPMFGFYLSAGITQYIQAVAPYIAFVLLFFIGGKLFLGGVKTLRGKGDAAKTLSSLHPKILLPLTVATSIDALVVGVQLAVDRQEGIIGSAATIGAVTFMLSAAAVLFGRWLGARLRAVAEMLGGLVLVGIGVRVLIEHLLAL